MVQVQVLVTQLSGFGGLEYPQGTGIGEQIHGLDEGLVMGDREKDGGRFIPVGDQEALPGIAELGQPGLRPGDGEGVICNFHCRAIYQEDQALASRSAGVPGVSVRVLLWFCGFPRPARWGQQTEPLRHRATEVGSRMTDDGRLTPEDAGLTTEDG